MTDDSALRALYAESYPRLVGVVRLAVGGCFAEAEDLVQEAFARLVPRWSSVEAPEAWVCTVALRLAANRRRKQAFQAKATLPADATFTGYHLFAVELWTAPSDAGEFVYLVNGHDRDDVERWVGVSAVCR